jgi:hypothetical protein
MIPTNTLLNSRDDITFINGITLNDSLAHGSVEVISLLLGEASSADDLEVVVDGTEDVIRSGVEEGGAVGSRFEGGDYVVDGVDLGKNTLSVLFTSA